MTTSKIRNKLYEYIRVAEDKKVKAIYTMLEEEIEELHEYWKDKNFIAGLEKRSADFKSGKIKSVNWKDAKAQILSSRVSAKKK